MKRAYIPITLQFLHDVLGLPDSIQVVGTDAFEVDRKAGCFVAHVVGDALPDVADGADAMRMTPQQVRALSKVDPK